MNAHKIIATSLFLCFPLNLVKAVEAETGAAKLNIHVIRQQARMLHVSAKNIKSGIRVAPEFSDIGTLYLDYMDSSQAKELPRGFRYLQGQTNAINKKSELAKIMGLFGSYDIKVPIILSKGPNGLYVIQPSYQSPFSKRNEKQGSAEYKDFEQAFDSYFRETVRAVGGDASGEAIEESLRLVKDLSDQLGPNGKRFLTKPITFEQLEGSSSFVWLDYLIAMDPTYAQQKVQVVSPKLFQKFTDLTEKYRLAAWKNLLLFTLTDSFGDLLPLPYQKRKNEFFRNLTGHHPIPRSIRAVYLVQQLLPEPLSKAYALAYFGPEVKAEMSKLKDKAVNNLMEKIQHSESIDSKTKKLLTTKLTSVNVVVGYPDEIRYKPVKVTKGAVVENILELRKRRVRQGLRIEPETHFGNDSWRASLAMNAKQKQLFIPAAFLQDPGFNPNDKDSADKVYTRANNLMRYSLVKTMFSPLGIWSPSEAKKVEMQNNKLQKVFESFITESVQLKYSSYGQLPRVSLEYCIVEEKCRL